MTNNFTERIKRIEKKLDSFIENTNSQLSSLESAVKKLAEHLPVELVKDVLGGVQIEREEISSQPVEDGTEADGLVDATPYGKQQASSRAQTLLPQPLTRNFRPSTVGYTAEMFKQDYPDLNPAEVMEAFFTHHLSKGDKSNNWLERFFSFATKAEQIRKEREVPGWGETDSMGLPLDLKKRREMMGYEQEREQ